MGYPMTWRRLINRNGLADGDYGNAPIAWTASAGKTAWAVVLESACKPDVMWRGQRMDPVSYVIELGKTTESHQQQAVEERNAKAAFFAGDLRRLERDTVDEGSICKQIAQRIGVDSDVVAMVLKEWMAV